MARRSGLPERLTDARDAVSRATKPLTKKPRGGKMISSKTRGKASSAKRRRYG